MTLELLPLQRAISRLEEGLERYQRDTSDIQIRDGLIQRFEFTFELSYKMLQRYLEFVSPTPMLYRRMAFQDIIRSGNEYGLLLGNWPTWRNYRDMRGKTSHTYNEDLALEVIAKIPRFLDEARYLYRQLAEGLNENIP